MAEFAFELRTTALPTIRTDSDELLAPGDGAAPWWGPWLKPEFIIRHPFGTWTRAPYGSPGETSWPLLGIVLAVIIVAVLALAVVGLLSLLRR